MDENDIIERRTCISGSGQSYIGRRLFRDPLDLTPTGVLAAIEHAGLTPATSTAWSTTRADWHAAGSRARRGTT